ncbi:mannose-1-phosphate guanylyltransferase/mannose-6-phosphate isomerase, partial [Oleiphilus sp. HI0125]
GYIKASTISADGTGDVEQFVEKPDLETAQSYLADGNYLWNSGMFMFKASVFLEELEKFRPDIAQATKAAFDGRRQDLDFTRLDEAKFEACPDESIDYAIMEKTEQALVVSLDAGWSDVGSWSSLWEESEQDEDGNSLRGDVLAYESKNNLLFSDHKLIATVGVENLVVVDTPDAVLVSTKDKVQDVKKVVDRLKQEGRSEATIHREVMRPWGFYDSIDKGERFQVKRITVNPGEKLSLQMHHHR